jgi:hypothetical protein
VVDDVVVGVGVVAAGATGACTLPVDLVLPHAPARATSNANAAMVVVFILRLLVA